MTLTARGWSVWWDRKIPLGKSYDEVIENALGESKCAIVLWSAMSAASEWVRNEASKRSGVESWFQYFSKRWMRRWLSGF